jgi:hypothetical protein
MIVKNSSNDSEHEMTTTAPKRVVMSRHFQTFTDGPSYWCGN